MINGFRNCVPFQKKVTMSLLLCDEVQAAKKKLIQIIYQINCFPGEVV